MTQGVHHIFVATHYDSIGDGDSGDGCGFEELAVRGVRASCDGWVKEMARVAFRGVLGHGAFEVPGKRGASDSTSECEA